MTVVNKSKAKNTSHYILCMVIFSFSQTFCSNLFFFTFLGPSAILHIHYLMTY